MRAIILAGKGLRLNGAAGDLPKCLVRVGELTLIERQIIALRKSGIDEIVVLIGFGADSVRRMCESDCEYVENLIYYCTNSLYSLWLARHRLSWRRSLPRAIFARGRRARSVISQPSARRMQ